MRNSYSNCSGCIHFWPPAFLLMRGSWRGADRVQTTEETKRMEKEVREREGGGED